jgi:catalase
MRAAMARMAISKPTNPLTDITTRADIFQRAGEKTPAFVRFSTVAGNKGSADLARDVRGFAVKLYTQEGNWDIVGNNIPVFFIQDAIKFPDLIHSAKPEPDRDFPQAQTAHDNFWDFIVADAGKHAHDHVDHVRPRHPPLVPLHGRVWRPHLPAAQRQG